MVVTRPEDIEALFRSVVQNVDLVAREIGAVYFLDPEANLQEAIYFQGEPSSVFFPIDDIIRAAHSNGSSKLVIAHSHPNATHSPSLQDHGFLTFLHQCLAGTGVSVADFLIFSQYHLYSARRASNLHPIMS